MVNIWVDESTRELYKKFYDKKTEQGRQQMKRYDLFGYDADVEERQAGRFIEYEDAARIIAQRDILLQLVSDMLPYVELCDHDGTNAEELRESYPESAAVIDALRARALAELDKEKQS